MGRPCNCCGNKCNISKIPDWNIDGFTKTDWSQYGECCWLRTYTRTNLTEGIEIHTQNIYKNSIIKSVHRDFYGWWVREFWAATTEPPGNTSLYPSPVPNTCWNPYGLVASYKSEYELESSARQEVQFQITKIIVTVHQVFNSCTEKNEYYVRVTTNIRWSDRVNTITYSRNTLIPTIFDECYEFTGGGFSNNFNGTKTFTMLPPSWAYNIGLASLFKYNSFEEIPDILSVDITTSPVESINDSCFNNHICKPHFPIVLPVCVPPISWPIPEPYACDDRLETRTDNCILSRIRTFGVGGGVGRWGLCPEDYQAGFGSQTEIIMPFNRTCWAGGPLRGYGVAISSVTACDPLIYNILVANTTDTFSYGAGFIRKPSCSPRDLIPCEPFLDPIANFNTYHYAPKTYPVTNSYRDLTCTKSHDVYSRTNICMNSTTFNLTS